MIKYLSLFSGIGAFEKALENLSIIVAGADDNIGEVNELGDDENEL